ncbi:MAG: hypothetical protein AAGJ50_11480 [Pseudomonadota bacterium]
MSENTTTLIWHKVAEPGEVAEGRVKSASAGSQSVALVHFKGQYAAMDNKAPTKAGLWAKGRLKKALMTNAGCAVRGMVGTLTR